MNPINSPATTTNHYASTDPTHVGAASSVHGASGHVATLGHPADGVVVGQGFASSHTTTAPVTGVTHHTTHAAPVTHTTTTTTHHVQPAVAAVPAQQPHHTIPSGANGDGLLVNSNLGGPLGGSVVLGGQCECLRNGGVCKHGAGMCTCRGCTTAATSINPGINVGVSTHQYTAPVGTSGIGGGVASPGVGMSGVVNPTNPAGHVVNHSAQNCDCVRNHGVCKCKPGECNCTNCVGHRKSLAATQAAHTTGATTTHHTVTHHA